MIRKQEPRPTPCPSPWARRMYVRLKRLVGHNIAAIERRASKQRGPKPWRGKARKPAGGQT